jgi:GntR family transcriptional regulator, carbon starvation induced regulator
MAAPESRGGRTGKPTVVGKLTEQLRADILRGALAPGAPLNLDNMRGAMQVSVSTLREAVTRLVSSGLIEAEEQKGYRVMPISLSNLAEVTRLRMELEPMALTAAIANGGLDWEAEVVGALHRLNRTERRSGDTPSIEAWEAAHTAFHRALLVRCDMPLLLGFIDGLHNMNDRYRRILLATHPGQRNVAEEHSAIAEAAVARRIDDAERLLKAHLERTGSSLRRLLNDTLPEVSA